MYLEDWWKRHELRRVVQRCDVGPLGNACLRTRILVYLCASHYLRNELDKQEGVQVRKRVNGKAASNRAYLIGRFVFSRPSQRVREGQGLVHGHTNARSVSVIPSPYLFTCTPFHQSACALSVIVFISPVNVRPVLHTTRTCVICVRPPSSTTFSHNHPISTP